MSTWILGVSALYHDAAAALIRDGVIVGAAQEERFTRIKHDPSLPLRSVQWLLEKENLTIDDIDYLVFYEKPLKKFERVLAMSVANFPFSWKSFPIQMHAWLGDKLWIRNKLSNEFDIPVERILFSEHHMSHAASAFFCSPYKEAAILTIDGVGEWATTALWRGTDEPPYIESVSEIRYPHSLGLFYSAVTAHLGFVVNNGEYKVMGMAAYGKPTFKENMQKMVKLHEDGSFSLDLKYFCHHRHHRKATTPAFDKELGPPRSPREPFDLSESAPEAVRKASQHWANIAASAQSILEDALLHLLKGAKAKVPSRNLCMAGGVALNAAANKILAQSNIFERIWVQPAAGDAGGSIGAALWAWHTILKNAPSHPYFSIDLGRSWSREEIKEYLDDFGMDYEEVGEESPQRAAQDLADGKLIAWYDGRFEWGPRSLGHRSILADPRDANNRDKINQSVKFREQFRPFAPITLASEVQEWFEVPPSAIDMLPYMVCTVDVKSNKAHLIPAVTHKDGSARVQAVDEHHNGNISNLLQEFKKLTNVPILINTSFNIKGDPIVSSPVDAIATFLKSKLDLLYIDGFQIRQPKRRWLE